MTDPTKKQLQDVQRLLAERRKFEQWLSQLETRKGATPGHVYEKVHADYVARLRTSQERLAAETVAVKSLVTELESSLGAHERQIGEKSDEREEAELRHSVGEFREKDWEGARAKLDGAIAESTRERDVVLRELTGLRSLLSEASPPAASVVLAEEHAPAAEVPPADRASAAPSAPSAPALTSGGAEAGAPAFDELAFLKSVVGRTTPYTGPAGQAAVPPVPDALAPQARRTPRGTASAARAVAPAGASSRPAPHDPLPAPVPVPARSNHPDSDTHAGLAEPRSSGSFGMPTPRSSEAVKTLKCQECGTLNFPTEWYCERCGGELAAF